MITVIDYGMGNIRSVVKAVERYTDSVRVSADPSAAQSSDALIMPGDGAFGHAMENLKKNGWVEVLKEYINSNKYFLGICLGFQLLFTSSEEFGLHEGLDIIPGRVVKFDTPGLKVPHMGWNDVEVKVSSKFLQGVDSGSYFYFIHTYYPEVKEPSWIIGEAEYGVKFPCIVGKGNVIAAQFHPEKSHNKGLMIIENFVKMAELAAGKAE